ncbi:MAG: acyl carrier protein [Clostridia bacterium]|nr:acyl carrier protein [Clostridia bacterium]
MIFDNVKRLVAEQLMIDESEITLETDFIADLSADSLDLVQLLILLEKEYGISFTDDEIKSVKTVGDVVAFIEKNKK